MHSYLVYSMLGRFFGGMYYLIVIGLVVVTVIAQWRIFEKAGHDGILALIPIINVVVMCQIAQVSPWIILLFFIPVINILAVLYMEYNYIESFGLGFGGFLLYLFFGGLMEIYMGFSDQVVYMY